MQAHKQARILNGDPNYADSWHDIAGYATLVEQELAGTPVSPTLAAPTGVATPNVPVTPGVQPPVAPQPAPEAKPMAAPLPADATKPTVKPLSL